MTLKEMAFEESRMDMQNIGISDEELLEALEGLTDEEIKEFLEIE